MHGLTCYTCTMVIGVGEAHESPSNCLRHSWSGKVHVSASRGRPLERGQLCVGDFRGSFGAAARTASGDLSKEAIVHAYGAMAAAVADALSRYRLVIAVGSFRSEEQRRRFRDIATSACASVTILRILCPVETAAQRVRSRLASGERGPTADAMRQIDAELNRASEIDAILTNDSSVDSFHRRVDSMLQALEWGAEHDASNASIMQRFQQLAAGKSAPVGEVVRP
jgi:predicted kinase